ncbi:MAG: hypothetical protein HY812_07690 [Planctomycetes bacterium]|nr:hypothetical protein [Planctomycetota bacterium]
MKQVYLKPRGGARTELRSDVLFGLIAWAVREVYGRDSIERFLAPARRDPPEAPLALTSAFPYADEAEGRLHYFPRPLSRRGAGASPWMEDRELLAFVAGREVADRTSCGEWLAARDAWEGGGSRNGRAAGGLFFLAAGPAEHTYLEPALRFLERTGFGGGRSNGLGAYDVELREAEFLRLAQPGELALLLSLYFPTPGERQAIQAAAEGGLPIHYALERRRGVVGGRLQRAERPFKRAVAMLREGSILPCASAPSCGCSPVVGEVEEDGERIAVIQHGFGFLVPVTGVLT